LPTGAIEQRSIFEVLGFSGQQPRSAEKVFEIGELLFGASTGKKFHHNCSSDRGSIDQCFFHEVGDRDV
jgi:hypothetical protein